MEKYKYADTVKINVKPDGSVVCSLYVNDSKEKKEHFKNAARMKKAAGSNGNSNKKRTVAVSKSTKEKHRDKLRVESYLQANSWEYVLRVPITSVDYSTTWKNFKNKYGYRHKERPLQYVMVKGDGELYGAISNAPVEGDKIPLVNVEHSIVSAFDKSLIKQMTALSLRYEYKGKEHSYVSSNGLNEKTFEFVDLGGIEYFPLPDDALVTQMQASLVFNGGTVEENLAAARRFIEAKKVLGSMEEEFSYHKYRMKSDITKYVRYNNFKGIAASVAGSVDDLEITEPVLAMYDGKERTIVKAIYEGQVVFAEANYESLLDRFPVLYFIMNWKSGLIYYIGLAKEPLVRFCDHFGYNYYAYKDRDRFLKTAQEKGWDLKEFRMDFIPSAGFFAEDGLFIKSEMVTSYDLDSPEYVHSLNKRSKHTDKMAEGDEAVMQWWFYENEEFRSKYLYIGENGLPLYWKDEAAKNNAEIKAKEHLEHWSGKYPVEEAMRVLAGEKEEARKAIWDINKMFVMMQCANVVRGNYDVDSPVFHEIVKRQAAFLQLGAVDMETFIARIKNMTT